jgi:hypothetical protein
VRFFILYDAICFRERERERERWGGGDKTTLLLTGNTEVHRGRKCQMVISLITQGPQVESETDYFLDCIGSLAC